MLGFDLNANLDTKYSKSIRNVVKGGKKNKFSSCFKSYIFEVFSSIQHNILGINVVLFEIVEYCDACIVIEVHKVRVCLIFTTCYFSS